MLLEEAGVSCLEVDAPDDVEQVEAGEGRDVQCQFPQRETKPGFGGIGGSLAAEGVDEGLRSANVQH